MTVPDVDIVVEVRVAYTLNVASALETLARQAERERE